MTGMLTHQYKVSKNGVNYLIKFSSTGEEKYPVYCVIIITVDALKHIENSPGGDYIVSSRFSSDDRDKIVRFITDTTNSAVDDDQLGDMIQLFYKIINKHFKSGVDLFPDDVICVVDKPVKTLVLKNKALFEHVEPYKTIKFFYDTTPEVTQNGVFVVYRHATTGKIFELSSQRFHIKDFKHMYGALKSELHFDDFNEGVSRYIHDKILEKLEQQHPSLEDNDDYGPIF